MSNFIDLTNQKFNYLTVLSYVGKNANGKTKTCGQTSCKFDSEIKRNSQILLELPEYVGERRAIYNVIARKTWKNIMI